MNEEHLLSIVGRHKRRKGGARGPHASNEMDEMNRPLQLIVRWPMLVPRLCLAQGAKKHASQVPGFS